MAAIQDIQSYEYTPETASIPYCTIPDLMREKSKKCPDRESIICYSSTGKRFSITYSELYRQSEMFARGISTLGYERHSIVAIETINIPEWLICTFGSQMAGLIPLHFGFEKPNGEDIVAILNGVGNCVAIIVDSPSISICKTFCEDIQKATTNVSSKIPTLKNVILMNENGDDYLSHCKLIEIGESTPISLPTLSADDICGIFLTSGSTGNAKAVSYTHRKMCVVGYDWYNILELQPGEKIFDYFPFGWSASYPVMMLSHEVTHVTLVNLRELTSVEEINKLTLQCLDTEICVSAVLLAPGICDLIQQDNLVCRSFPLRVVCTAGLPVDALCAKIIGTKATKFAVVYGSTEIGMSTNISVLSPNNYENYLTGKPVPGIEVKIIGKNGQIVSRGTPGEIFIRTRDRFLGYKNAEVDPCDDRGWYRSGDVGYMKPGGNVVVTGRNSEVMIISGDLVSPVYLEGLLKEHPSIMNAYVYPVYNQQTFQQACAAVLLRKGKTVTKEELNEFITVQKGRYSDSFLATRHVPQIYLFLDSFPSTQSGKLNRKALVEIIKEKLGIY